MSQQPRFEDLTETTGVPVSAEGASMMATRYNWAAGFCAHRRVLELGGGSGIGWRMLSSGATAAVCGDYSMPLLRAGRRHTGPALLAVALSADRIPFAAGAFDLVVLFEALYYVPDPEAAIDEINRVLAPGGMVLFANANPQRPDFIASPHSVRYYTADELGDSLRSRGFLTSTFAAFPVEPRTGSKRAGVVSSGIQLARRLASALGLIPRTLRGRAVIKRLMFGHLISIPESLTTDFAPTTALVAVERGPVTGFKVFYTKGIKPLN